MKLLTDIYKNTGQLHHAYLLQGEKNQLREKLLAFIEKDLKHPVKANPDFWHRQHDTFTIDDARALREAQANKAMGNSKKIFVIEVQSMTLEAQNSLLKIFEEPTPDTHFFIIVQSAEIFLPTLKSRVVIVSSESDQDIHSEKVRDFMLKAIPERLKYVAALAEEKDKVGAIDLVDGLIHEQSKAKNKNVKVLRELLMTRGYLNDRSPSIKLLLEHISLII